MVNLPTGLYAITPDQNDTECLLRDCTAVLANGAAVLQYRNKLANAALREVQASALLALCQKWHVPLIINDHLELALNINADGLHLGAEDGDISTARRRLGANRLLGASCYNRPDLAATAVAAGANYVAFGAMYPSRTKPNAITAASSTTALTLIKIAKQTINCPIVAIGGLTLNNTPPIWKAGINNVAVIRALFDAPDIAAATGQWAALCKAT